MLSFYLLFGIRTCKFERIDGRVMPAVIMGWQCKRIFLSNLINFDLRKLYKFVVPAQAGIHAVLDRIASLWIPACAGTTEILSANLPNSTNFKTHLPQGTHHVV